MKVSIIIATYGDDFWRQLALKRSYSSAINQGAHEIIVGHDEEGTVASVRNELAEKAEGDWLCFLDGDDELAPGYLDAMQRAFEQVSLGGSLLLAPAVSYVSMRGKVEPAKFWGECSLTTGNWLVIGTLVEREMFFKVGGFEEWPIYEDWALWARCWTAGAVPVKVPEAVYRAHRKPGSRNHSLPRKEVLRVYEEMKAALFP